MSEAEQIDYNRDSLCEILLKQRVTIERQGGEQIRLALQNVALRADAELVMSEEHQRFSEVMYLVENWVHGHVALGHTTVDAGALLDVLRDVLEYAEEGKEPAWLEPAVSAMGGE